MALQNIGFNVNIADYVDFDKNVVKAFNILHDTNFKPTDIREYHYKGPNLDLVLFGSPCQDFSIVGKGAGGEKNSGTRSSLLWEAVRVVEEMKEKPKFVIWENVVSVLSKRHKDVYFNYIKKMESLGYYLHASILQATDFGLPQTRKRVFVVASFEEIKLKSIWKTKWKSLINFIDTKFDFEKYNYMTKEWLANNNYYQKNMQNEYWGKGTINIPFSSYHSENQVRLVSEKYPNATVSTLTAGGILANQRLAIPVTKDINNKAAVFRINNENWVIRKMHALENWKLMGFKEEEYWKLEQAGFSSSKIKFLAGNSIVVNVLENLFKVYIKWIKN